MRANINEAFRHIPVVGPYVMEEHYDLTNVAKQEYIPMGLWENTIKPGDSIVMTMRPSSDHILRGPFYGGGPPYGMPLRQASDMHAQSTRQERLRQFHRSQGGIPYTPRHPMPYGPHTGPPPHLMRPPMMGMPINVMRPPPPPPMLSVA